MYKKKQLKTKPATDLGKTPYGNTCGIFLTLSGQEKNYKRGTNINQIENVVFYDRWGIREILKCCKLGLT